MMNEISITPLYFDLKRPIFNICKKIIASNPAVDFIMTTGRVDATLNMLETVAQIQSHNPFTNQDATISMLGNTNLDPNTVNMSQGTSLASPALNQSPTPWDRHSDEDQPKKRAFDHSLKQGNLNI